MSDSDERWYRVDQIFTEALDLPAEQRRAFVHERCGGDSKLAKDVEALLAAADDETFLRDPKDRVAIGTVLADVTGEVRTTQGERPADDPLVGATLGPYRVVRELGHGGMGSVYLAERTHGFDHRVAIKTLRRGIDTDEVVQRFLAERQILAQLDHPNIAQLFDGGVTPDGRPYFVLEFVQGKAVTTHADEHRLGLRERIGLLTTVADAIHHAHQHLVVHRDLKPSNVLVTDDGVIKLLDFGIARLVGSSRHEGSPRTAASLRVFTPEYAAPEQVARAAITTATDVYQLGVLSYELLSGVRPYAEGLKGLELEHAVVDEDPDPLSKAPSRASQSAIDARGFSDSRSLGRALAGDLEVIVTKALAKEPQRRYASVEAFSADLRRYSDGLPISARPATLRYRFSRFRHRNRWSMPAFAATAAGLLLYLGSSIQHSRALTAERNLAQIEAARAEVVTTFVTDLIGMPNPWSGGGRADITLLEALEDGTGRIEREFAGQPALQARLYQTLGSTYFGLGRFEAAEAGHRRAADLWRATEGDSSLHTMSALRGLGRTVAETQGADSARAVLEPLLGHMTNPASDDEHLLLADVLESLARVHWIESDFDSTFVLYELAHESLANLSTPHPLREAAILRDHSRALANADRHPEALTLSSQAVAMLEPTVASDHLELAAARRQLGSALSFPGGRHEEALAQLDKALRVYEARFEPGHPTILDVQYDRAYALLQAGQLQEAERGYRKLVDQYEAHDAGSRSHASALQNLAVALNRQGRLDEALTVSVHAHEVYEAALGLHYQTAYPLLTASEIALNRGRFAEGLDLASRAFDILQQTLPEGHSATWVALCRRGWGRWETGLRQQGLEDLRMASAALDVSSYGRDHPHSSTCREVLARAEGG